MEEYNYEVEINPNDHEYSIHWDYMYLNWGLRCLKSADGKYYNTVFNDIWDFHEKFQPDLKSEIPRQMPADLAEYRMGFLDEELQEYKDAYAAGDLAKQMDALVDLMYVLLGNALISGFPFPKAWEIVHAANMKKARAAKPEQSKRGSAFDVYKPEGWESPDAALAELINMGTNAYNRNE